MIVFLKGRKLQRYVTGSIPKLVPIPKSKAKTDADASMTTVAEDDYEARLEEQNSIQSKILSWFINTFVLSIHSLLPCLGTTAAAWIFLSNRYNCTNDSSLEFHNESKLYQMHQETGQSIFYYYSQTSSMWEQLSAADPSLRYPKDIKLFAKYRYRHRFMYFMMGLREDFEPTRAYLLSWSPTPSLDATIKEIIFDKNRRPTYHMSSSNHVLATLSLPPQPSIAAITAPLCLTSRRPSSQSSKGTCCEFCRAKGHDISICHKLQKFMQEQNKAPTPRAAAICLSDSSVPTGPSLTSSLTTCCNHMTRYCMLDIACNYSWLFDTACYNHMTRNESQFSDKALLAHPISIYTVDGTPILVSHKGTISTSSLSLSDTFHISKLSLNLLSVGQLCEL